MGTLIKADGTKEPLMPKNGKSFVFEGELYDVIGCTTIQAVHLGGGRMLLCDEDAKVGPNAYSKPVNKAATELLHKAGGLPFDQILGVAVITNDGEME